MDFFDKIKSTAKTIGDKSADMVDLAKLKATQLNVESGISQKEKELGHLVYTLTKEGREDAQKIAAICEDIDQLHIQLDELKRKAMLVTNKNATICPVCNVLIDEGAKFCPNCGKAAKNALPGVVDTL